MKSIEIAPTRKILARFIFGLHLFCVFFLVTGSLWPISFLKTLLIAIPLVILQWFLNDSHCVLTQIQHRIEGRNKTTDEQEGQFVKELFLRVGLDPSRGQLMFIIYFVLLSNWVIAFCRL